MFKVMILLVLIYSYGFTHPLEKIHETINVKVLFIFGFLSILLYLYNVYFLSTKKNYSIFDRYSNYLFTQLRLTNLNSSEDLKKLSKIKNKLSKKIIKNNIYYIIFDNKMKKIILSEEFSISNIDNCFNNIQHSLKDVEHIAYFFCLPKNKFYVNYTFYFLISSFISKLFPYNLKSLTIFITIFSILIYAIWSSYIYNLIVLLGIPLSFVNYDMSVFFHKLFTDILLSFSPLFIFNGSIVMFVFLILLVLFISMYFFKYYKSFFKYLDFLKVMNLLVLLYVLMSLSSFLIYRPILTMYKIQVPKNNSIKISDISLIFGDYLKFTENYRILEIKNKRLLMISENKSFIYYYNIEENKNILLDNEIKLIKKKNELTNCNEIINNLNQDKKANKLNIILLNNSIINTRLLKRLPFREFSNYNEIEVEFEKDFKVDEIINKCEILSLVKNETNIDFFGFSKFNNLELIKWIGKNKFEKKDEILKIKDRIEKNLL